MQYKTIASERKGGVAILYLDRPEVLNALSVDMRHELIHFLQEAWDDEEGRGRTFVTSTQLWIDAEEFIRATIAEHFAGEDYAPFGFSGARMPIEDFLAMRRPTRAGHYYKYEGD